MAGDWRTIRVTGLPVDGSENRLVDKLQIHFLRKKNGGGEISSVTLSKTIPGTAFITFEESEVASRLAQKGKQVFKVSDKSYDITISLHHEKVDVDKVLLCMSVVVDHRMLPGGKNTLFFLQKSFPDVNLIFNDQKDLYTLQGRYSEVQALSSLLMESLEQQDQRSSDKPQLKTESRKTYNSLLEESANSLLGVKEDVRGVKHSVQSEDLESENWKTGLPLPGSYSDHASQAALVEAKYDSAQDIETSIEDFSLIVDSDIFRYLNKYCSKEYESILRQHKVEVLDVNCDDITTLYLKPKTALSEHGIGSVKKAHQDLAHLYQQKESQLRKEHVYKHGIPEKELSHALEGIRTRMPRLMIYKEDRNVYMVGSKNDVSEAKQFIVDMRGFGMKNEIHSDHLFVPSQSKSTSMKQGNAASSDTSGIMAPSFQDTHDLFTPRKDLRNANQKGIPTENSSEKGPDSVESKHFHGHSPTGQFSFQSQRTDKPTEDIFSLRRTEVSQKRHVPSDREEMEPADWLDRNKYTDSFLDTSKPSAPSEINDNVINKDFISETAELQSSSGARPIISETQIKSNKTCKTKQTDPVKEWKMAANFSGEMMKDLTSYKSEAPKSLELKERKFADSEQPHSLPLTKPSVYSNLDPNTVRGSAKSSASKTGSQELKGDMPKPGLFSYDKKPTMTQTCVSGDQAVRSFPTVTSGSPRIRPSSFSGRIKKGEETTHTAVDLSAELKEISQNVQTREIVAMDLVLPFRLWLYISSVYNNEIENLTSDLQVKERMDKEDIILCLRGVNSEKVGECHHGLKSLIATAEMDFDARTLPLSKLGVSDSKDKTLLELCALMKQRYKMVKILVLSNDMMILGPKPSSDEIETIMINFFHEGGNIANLKLENKKSPNSDHLHSSKVPDTDLKLVGDQSRTSAKPNTDVIMKDLSKTSDQNGARSSKKVPQVLTNQTKDTREQDNESGIQDKTKEEKLEQSDKKAPTSMQDDGGTTDKENKEASSCSTMNSDTKDTEAGEDPRVHTSTTAQSKESFTEQTKPGMSVDQARDSQGSEPKSDMLPTHASENQNLLKCDVCEREHSAVKQACGANFCPECKKDTHTSCKVCATSGIKGTMSIQESTITLSGFNRDTTLKIIYDIPDGIQGENHPCPGAPFKGNRFEAFLPQNKTTKKLLPLLEKAFHEGLTFTVKVGSSGDGSGEGRVVWGSVPHKTRTEGGACRNGYPDFTYITRLEEFLKAAGIGE